MIVYKIDEYGVWDGNTVDQSPKEPITGKVLVEPPILGDGESAVWNGSEWSVVTELPAIPLELPTKVTMRQARLALLEAGQLDAVTVMVNTIPVSAGGDSVKIEWEYAADVDRNHEWVQSLSSQMGWTDTDLDNLFAIADTYKAE